MRRQRLQDRSFGCFDCIHPWCFSLHCFHRRGGVFWNKVASMQTYCCIGIRRLLLECISYHHISSSSMHVLLSQRMIRKVLHYLHHSFSRFTMSYYCRLVMLHGGWLNENLSKKTLTPTYWIRRYCQVPALTYRVWFLPNRTSSAFVHEERSQVYGKSEDCFLRVTDGFVSLYGTTQLGPILEIILFSGWCCTP